MGRASLLLPLALVLALVALVPSVAAAKHVAIGTVHATGHLVPFMALAKELKHRYPSMRVSFIVSDFGREIVERQLGPLDIGIISMGSPPWTYEEDLKMVAELVELPFLQMLEEMSNFFGAYERVGTAALIESFNTTRPDFIVLDPIVSAIANAADYHGIPYMYMHTSGLPLMDSWNSFFVRKPVHIPIPIIPPMEGIVNSPLKRLMMKSVDIMTEVMGWLIFTRNHQKIRLENGLPPSAAFVRSHDLPTPILISSAWGFTEAMSLPPYVQLVGSVFDPEISPAPPLSHDLSQWLDQHDDKPIVYISTGTNVRLTDEQLSSLAEAFNSLEQYRFLWSLRKEKYSTEIPSLKSHIRMENFVPQVAVLAHKNVKVFLSHCGQNSMLESVWNRVPILALPFMGDQFSNAHTLVSNGAALLLPSTNITTDLVEQSLQRLIREKSFVNNMDRLAELLEIAGGKEQAARWVWLIAHHGSSFLMPKELEVGWFLFYELDILLFEAVVLMAVAGGCWLIVRVIRRCLFGSRSSSVSASRSSSPPSSKPKHE